MARVYVFGSASLISLPDNVRLLLQNLVNQGAEFYIGDNSTVDVEIQKYLSCIGVAKTSTLVTLESAKNNKYNLKERVYTLEFNEDLKEAKIINPDTKEVEVIIPNVDSIEEARQNKFYKDFIKHTLIKESDFVLCLYDGVTKNTMATMEFVYKCNKPNYIYKLVKA